MKPIKLRLEERLWYRGEEGSKNLGLAFKVNSCRRFKYQGREHWRALDECDRSGQALCDLAYKERMAW